MRPSDGELCGTALRAIAYAIRGSLKRGTGTSAGPARPHLTRPLTPPRRAEAHAHLRAVVRSPQDSCVRPPPSLPSRFPPTLLTTTTILPQTQPRPTPRDTRPTAHAPPPDTRAHALLRPQTRRSNPATATVQSAHAYSAPLPPARAMSKSRCGAQHHTRSAAAATHTGECPARHVCVYGLTRTRG